MQTIIIVLDPKKMENPDLGIWLDAEEANKNAKSIIHLFKTERISDNDLSGAAEIYVSEENCADLDKCQKVYPI